MKLYQFNGKIPFTTERTNEGVKCWSIPPTENDEPKLLAVVSEEAVVQDFVPPPPDYDIVEHKKRTVRLLHAQVGECLTIVQRANSLTGSRQPSGKEVYSAIMKTLAVIAGGVQGLLETEVVRDEVEGRGTMQ